MVFLLDLLSVVIWPQPEQRTDWRQSYFELLDHQLVQGAGDDELQQHWLTVLEERLGTGVQLASESQVHLMPNARIVAENYQPTTIDLNQLNYQLVILPVSGYQLLLGPMDSPHQLPYSMVTVGFYLCVVLFVWIWLAPVLSGLEQLSQAAKLFAEDPKADLPKQRLREPVQQLAERFYRMAARIRTLLNTQQELSGALSHELRTPLARMKFALASAKGKVTGVADSEFDSIAQDVQELEQLVDTMLAYSRIEQCEAPRSWSLVSLKSLFDEVAEKYRWRTSAEISLLIDHDAQVMCCDRRLMQMALSNLIGNACRFAKGNICVVFHQTPEMQLLCVEDDGPGIDSSAYSLALQPFKKVNQTQKTEGFGLGLSIVSRVASLHSGEVILARASLGGLSVRISWPLVL